MHILWNLIISLPVSLCRISSNEPPLLLHAHLYYQPHYQVIQAYDIPNICEAWNITNMPRAKECPTIVINCLEWHRSFVSPPFQRESPSPWTHLSVTSLLHVNPQTYVLFRHVCTQRRKNVKICRLPCTEVTDDWSTKIIWGVLSGTLKRQGLHNRGISGHI